MRMDDAISRSAAIADLGEWWYRKPRDEYERGFNGGLIHAINRIVNDNVNPALDVTPVVHAKWVWNGFDGVGWECSHCKHENGRSAEKPTENYCPNCGAKMDAK